MLTPIYEADVLVLQVELEQQRDQELREIVKSRQEESSRRIRYLSRIIESVPADDTMRAQ